MDKSWMQLTNTTDPEYQKGVQEFLQFAFDRSRPVIKIRCPCMKCYNCYFRTREEAEDHLLKHGIVKSYVKWRNHGEYEKQGPDDDFDPDDEDSDFEPTLDEEVEGDFKVMIIDLATSIFAESSTSQGPYAAGGEVDTFSKLLTDAQKRLYPGCEKFSNVSFLVQLLHIKFVHRWTIEATEMFLKLAKDMFPEGNTIPGSYDEAKMMVRDFHLQVVKERLRNTGNRPASPSCSYELVELSSAVVQDRGFSTPGNGDYVQQGDPFFKGGVAENSPSKAEKVSSEKRTSSEFSSEVGDGRSSRLRGPPKTLLDGDSKGPWNTQPSRSEHKKKLHEKIEILRLARNRR
ncbi:hypothetical protein RHSIM_Rhsim12G0007200 [Rhododendron simsii]|uniref:Transposase-associated domain-containing protein n=1 Tax=Rhododendron simsii TaxID=118357 RepID=A0A834G2Y8_RHOSS|nr:hypothetical protein RHSIM_Rhsim12G0007200 [Rhododendron simsii]